MFDTEGKIKDIQYIKRRIFKGGTSPSIRSEVWKFIFQYYPWDSTLEERTRIIQKRKVEYEKIKIQWKNISDDQALYFSKYRNRCNLLDKDVIRTDRGHPMFEDTSSPHLIVLHDILLTYSFFNFDIGYNQGMNDLLVPFLTLLKDEVESFWCFKFLMDRMSKNFHKDQLGMQGQFNKLGELLRCLDPKLHLYLESMDMTNMYFCYRWIIIGFKREFSLEDISILWEVWFTSHHEDFHLFVAIGILIQNREVLMSQKFAFDETLQYINNLSMKMDLNVCIQSAEALIAQYEDINKQKKI